MVLTCRGKPGRSAYDGYSNTCIAGDIQIRTRWNFVLCADTAAKGVCSGSMESMIAEAVEESYSVVVRKVIVTE